MEKLKFKTTINATPEKVWDILWGDDTYGKWTSVFSEGSSAQTDWQKGSKVIFGDGNGNGMVSEVAERIDYKQMSFRHLGEVKGGVEDTTSERVQQWAGGLESYFLKDENGTTELTVELDMPDEFKDFFTDTFPKALQKVKELSEA